MLKAELNGRFCGSSEDRKAHRNSDSKDCALRIQVGTRLLLGIELKTILVTFWNRTCLHLVHALRLWEAEFTGDRPSKTVSTQVVARLLLAVCSETWE
jgi:hypothetical protein